MTTVYVSGSSLVTSVPHLHLRFYLGEVRWRRLLVQSSLARTARSQCGVLGLFSCPGSSFLYFLAQPKIRTVATLLAAQKQPTHGHLFLSELGEDGGDGWDSNWAFLG